MKKNFFIVLMIVMVFGTFSLLSSEVIQVKEKSAFCYTYMSFSGSFKTMPQKITQFMGEFFKQGLKPQGALISVYHNSPEQVKECELKWDIGFPISKDISINAPLKKATYEKKTVLEYLHQGGYNKLPEIYQKLAKYIKENGLTVILPTFEFYLNSPMHVNPVDLKTRIEIPVKKK